jgi:hypothetical protein
MIRLLGTGLVVLSLLSGRVSAQDGAARATVYLFFSEKTSSAPDVAKAALAFAKAHAPEVALRPALLVEDWTSIRKVTEDAPLYRTVRSLGEGTPIQVYDTEALRLAGAWKITRLPAVALVRNGRVHVVQGSNLDLEALWGCTR